MKSYGRPNKKTQTERNNNYEDKINEDHNELLRYRLCVGVLGCYNGGGHIGYRATRTRPARLQRGHAKGLVPVDLRRVRKPQWELRTGSRYARPPLQRRWYDAQYVRHGEHRGHGYLRRHRSGRNLYGRTRLHRHPVTGSRHIPNFQYIRRAGCTAGLDYPERPRWRWHPRTEQGNGGTPAVVKASQLLRRDSMSPIIGFGAFHPRQTRLFAYKDL